MKSARRPRYRRRSGRSWIGFAITLLICAAGLVMSRMAGGPSTAALAFAPAVDQHFSGCDEARAAGRENIRRSDPSYREWMDRDLDGLACEPYRR